MAKGNDSAGSNGEPDADSGESGTAESTEPSADTKLLRRATRRVQRWASPASGDLASAGFQFAASLLLFTLSGHWLDNKFGTGPWLLLAGLACGFTGGFYSLMRQALRAGRKS